MNNATVLAAVILANLGAIVGAYISLRVGVARLEVKVDKLEIDTQNLGRMIKNKNTEEKLC